MRNSGRIFKHGVDYAVIWEHKWWNIRSGRIGQAKYHGPKGSWSKFTVTFGRDDIQAKYATAHKALYAYAYKSKNYPLTKDLTITGLPTLNTGVIDGYNPKMSGRFDWFNANIVLVWTKDSKMAMRKNWDVEETMYHELGHASHYSALVRDKGKGHNILIMLSSKETGDPFPEFVSSCFMRSLYPNYLYRYDTRGGYNGLGEWLNYQGFTPKQIERIMCEENMGAWRRAAKDMHVADPVLVDAIFDYRWNIWRVNLAKPIIGPDKPETNTWVTYSVPNALPTGVRFTGWTVTGIGVTTSDYQISGGLAGATLNIKFTASKNYTLNANFRLPDGTLYTATRTIDIEIPTITSISVYPDVPTVCSGQDLSYTAHGKNLAQGKIEWETVSGCRWNHTGTGTTFSAVAGGNRAKEAVVRCRILYGGVYSSWRSCSVAIDDSRGSYILSVGRTEK